MRRLLVSLGALFALMLVGPGLVVAQDATPAAPATAALVRTDARYFLPFNRDGLNKGLTVKTTESAACASLSLADTGRPDAWECTGDTSHTSFDPCFENPFTPQDEPGTMACIVSPFATDVIALTLREPLARHKESSAAAGDPAVAMPDQSGASPAQQSPGQAQMAAPAVSAGPWDVPWALELSNGKRCTVQSGEAAVLAGERVSYGCDSNGLVVGEVDRSQPVWTVSYLADGEVGTHVVEVAVAWS